MKKNLNKKLVLKKLTVASLNAEKLNAFRGGKMIDSMAQCSLPCGPTISCDGCNTGGTGGGNSGEVGCFYTYNSTPICCG